MRRILELTVQNTLRRRGASIQAIEPWVKDIRGGWLKGVSLKLPKVLSFVVDVLLLCQVDIQFHGFIGGRDGIKLK